MSHTRPGTSTGGIAHAARLARHCALAVAFALPTVAAARSPAQTETWRGIVKALHQPVISTEIVAPVASVPVREAQRFAKGAVLVDFDCRRHKLELAAAAAAAREARTIDVSNRYLVAKGAANRNEVEIAAARYEKASAEWNAMRQRLEGCRILAPFDGIVIELAISAFEIPTPGKPLITIISASQLEIEIIVPSRRLSALPPGTALTFTIDETGAGYPIRIERSSGAVDTVSQTAKLFAVFTGRFHDVLPGMSGTAMGAPEAPR